MRNDPNEMSDDYERGSKEVLRVVKAEYGDGH
jgi:hypothetical protein